MGKGSGLHGSMLLKQCLTQEVRFQCGPQVPSLPRDGGIYSPTSCRWPGPGSLKPSRRSCWYRVPIRHLSSEDGHNPLLYFGHPVSSYEKSGKEVAWELVLLYHRCGCPLQPQDQASYPRSLVPSYTELPGQVQPQYSKSGSPSPLRPSCFPSPWLVLLLRPLPPTSGSSSHKVRRKPLGFKSETDFLWSWACHSNS